MNNKIQGINGKKETLEGKVKKDNKKEEYKMKEIDLEIPVLFYNSKEDDRKAYYALLKSGIPCEFRPPSEEPTPLLLVGYTEYIGLEEIMEYLGSEMAQKLKEKKS
ncbi:MAG: hypothetical protein KKF74_04955 [Nanoarchaeota archaeon]|nr:hypothetical protein [Nanoarchaeota archaeon]